MLTELDGLDSRKQVFIIAATNRPDIIDGAMLRPGRLDKILFVDLPEPEDRVEILKTLTRERVPLAKDVDLESIGKRSECHGFRYEWTDSRGYLGNGSLDVSEGLFILSFAFLHTKPTIQSILVHIILIILSFTPFFL